MSTATAKRILVLCRSAPYGSSRARDALDVAMACGAFDQQVSLLFLGEGVLALLRDQEPDPQLARNLAKILGALADYGISAIHADAESLKRFGLTPPQLALEVSLRQPSEMAALYAEHDIVLSV